MVAPKSFMSLRSERASVFAGEHRRPVRRPAVGEIHVGIIGRIGEIAVADLQITRRPVTPVHEMVSVLGTGRKTRAHAGAENLLALVGSEHHLAFEDEYELVLARV